ncbi:hypothetical protein VTN00DRAFT_1244 [Thermoascus crustaceus]|uniref:uncharacterized protein n=1 Tax=Thermoascus crustaceus TaxID=5088 RepID=UPI00374326B2
MYAPYSPYQVRCLSGYTHIMTAYEPASCSFYTMAVVRGWRRTTKSSPLAPPGCSLRSSRNRAHTWQAALPSHPGRSAAPLRPKTVRSRGAVAGNGLLLSFSWYLTVRRAYRTMSQTAAVTRSMDCWSLTPSQRSLSPSRRSSPQSAVLAGPLLPLWHLSRRPVPPVLEGEPNILILSLPRPRPVSLLPHASSLRR